MSFIDTFNEYFDKPKEIDFYSAFSQLHMLLTSGATLQQALVDVAPYLENKQLGQALINISRSLSTGINAGAAFKKESVFPTEVAPTIEAGERSGEVATAFLKLSEMMYLRHNLYSKVKNALFTPKMSAILMALMTVGYIKIAVPEFIKLYEENEIEMPGVVKVVSGTVNVIVDYWYITLLVIFLLWKAWDWFSESNVNLIDGWKFKVPIFKNLHFSFLQHQFASVISLMLSSGLTVPDALVQAGKVVSNSLMVEDIQGVRADVLKGMTLTDAIRKNDYHGTFDKMLIASINAGERSNNLTVALDQICKYYERKLNNMIDPVSTKLTLAVLIPMGIFIVLMYLFTMIPMFSYMNQVQM